MCRTPRLSLRRRVTVLWSTTVTWWLLHSRLWSASRRFRPFGKSASTREGECKWSLVISRMALAKEQQRLHKKTIIARVGHYNRVWYCRMWNSFVQLQPRRLKMFSEQNSWEKSWRLAKQRFFVSDNPRTTVRHSFSTSLLFDPRNKCRPNCCVNLHTFWN